MKRILINIPIVAFFVIFLLILFSRSALAACSSPLTGCSGDHPGYRYSYTPNCSSGCSLGCDGIWPSWPSNYTCYSSCGTCTPTYGTCSNSCGTGTKPYDSYNNCGAACGGGSVSCTVCSPASCSGYTYGSWGACSVSCGGGTQSRTQYYACSGGIAGSDSRSCNTQECNAPPTAPSVSTPTNGATGVEYSPTITLSSTDAVGDYIRYKIQIATNVGFTTGLQTFTQPTGSPQTGWSGQDTQTSTAYLSGSTATYTIQTPLAQNTLYYLRAYATDPGGGNTWSSASTSISFTTVTSVPNTPTLDSPANGATGISTSPVLKTTATDQNSDYVRYKVQVCTDSGMTANCQTFTQPTGTPQTGWSGQDVQTSTAYSSGTQGIYTVQTPLAGETTYYWRSYATDPGGSNAWSGTQSTPKSFTTGVACTPASNSSNTYSYTGGQQSWVVPAGVTSITVDAKGGQGYSANGMGGRVQTTLTTTPGDTLYVYVGGTTTSTAGGYNGGGNAAGLGAGGGGGASDIRQGGIDLTNRTMVAGGGGGGGTNLTGGNGGGTTGGNGGSGIYSGKGGTPSAGGAKGQGNGGSDGASGTGGVGAGSGAYVGGGGGGGYFGGGGGGSAYGSGGGGGGGSSYSAGSGTTHTQGYGTGAGEVIISWTAISTCSVSEIPTLDSPANGATFQSTSTVLKTTATNVNGSYLRYKIQVCTDSGMTANCQTFTEPTGSPQTGWTGQDVQTSTAYSSGTQGIYTVQTPLSAGTTYYWRSYAIDPGGSNTWSGTQATPYSFTTRAGSCGEPLSGNHTVSFPCVFTGLINGVDAGEGNANTAKLTIGTGGSIVIMGSETDSSLNQTIAAGSLELTGSGSIMILNGGSIKIGTPIFLPDADGDGYPTAVTSTQYIASGAGRVRRNLSLDYNDSSNTVYPGTACGGVCSVNSVTGGCVARTPAGEYGQATCVQCDGVALTPVNIGAGSQDTLGNNTCVTAHYACDGAGACTAPTTTSCVQRAAAPPGETCTAKCAAIANGISCVNGKSSAGCTGGTYSCNSGSASYCTCNVYQYN